MTPESLNSQALQIVNSDPMLSQALADSNAQNELFKEVMSQSPAARQPKKQKKVVQQQELSRPQDLVVQNS